MPTEEQILQEIDASPGGRISNEDLYYNLRVNQGQQKQMFRLIREMVRKNTIYQTEERDENNRFWLYYSRPSTAPAPTE